MKGVSEMLPEPKTTETRGPVLRLVFAITGLLIGIGIGATAASAIHGANYQSCSDDLCTYGDTRQDIYGTDWGTEFVWAGGDEDYVDLRDSWDRGHGEEDQDMILGAGGQDVIYGNVGRDVWEVEGVCCYGLHGGDGYDEIYGHDGTDYLFGGGYDDELRGQADNDALYGREGGDYLNGGAGYDLCEGGNDPGDTKVECETN